MKEKMHKRRRLAEMAASTIEIFVSPVTTKGGGPHVLLFLFMPFPSSRSAKRLSDFTAFAIIKTMEKFRGNSTGGGLV